jgi:hypothetical protein
MAYRPQCNAPAPPGEPAHVRCNREPAHDGPCRGDQSKDVVLFWVGDRLLARVVRNHRAPGKWIIDKNV